MSACSKFTPNVFKKEQCSACYQSLSMHSSTAVAAAAPVVTSAAPVASFKVTLPVASAAAGLRSSTSDTGLPRTQAPANAAATTTGFTRRISESTGASDAACHVCQTHVFPLERVDINGIRCHKRCFRCTQCQISLTQATCVTAECKLYCRTHAAKFQTASPVRRPSNANVFAASGSGSTTVAPPFIKQNSGTTTVAPPPINAPASRPMSMALTSNTGSGFLRSATAQEVLGKPKDPNACAVCEKTVYIMDKVEADEKKFHRWCFRCLVCSKTLSAGSYAGLAGKVYCKPHFKQLFALKGNYDEGFGSTQRKLDWAKTADSPVHVERNAEQQRHYLEAHTPHAPSASARRPSQPNALAAAPPAGALSFGRTASVSAATTTPSTAEVATGEKNINNNACARFRPHAFRPNKCINCPALASEHALVS